MNACQVILDNKEAMRAAGLVLVLGLEFWLGKTDKVQASSLLELLYNIARGPQPKPEFEFPTPAKPIEEKQDGQSL